MQCEHSYPSVGDTAKDQHTGVELLDEYRHRNDVLLDDVLHQAGVHDLQHASLVGSIRGLLIERQARNLSRPQGESALTRID